MGGGGGGGTSRRACSRAAWESAASAWWSRPASPLTCSPSSTRPAASSRPARAGDWVHAKARPASAGTAARATRRGKTPPRLGCGRPDGIAAASALCSVRRSLLCWVRSLAGPAVPVTWLVVGLRVPIGSLVTLARRRQPAGAVTDWRLCAGRSAGRKRWWWRRRQQRGPPRLGGRRFAERQREAGRGGPVGGAPGHV